MINQKQQQFYTLTCGYQKFALINVINLKLIRHLLQLIHGIKTSALILAIKQKLYSHSLLMNSIRICVNGNAIKTELFNNPTKTRLIQILVLGLATKQMQLHYHSLTSSTPILASMSANSLQLELNQRIPTTGTHKSVNTNANNLVVLHQLQPTPGIKQLANTFACRVQIRVALAKYGTTPHALVVALILALILVTLSQAFAHAHALAVMMQAILVIIPTYVHSIQYHLSQEFQVETLKLALLQMILLSHHLPCCHLPKLFVKLMVIHAKVM